MLDWLVVGGGVHGVHLALVLRRRAGVPASRLRILDPHALPLAAWSARTDRVAMPYLRSPVVHHLDLDPYDLKRFAATEAGRPYARFAEPYARPATALFAAHSEAVVARERLADLWIQGRALGLARRTQGWRVETPSGALDARRVVLALGPPPPLWPDWARSLRAAGAAVVHALDDTDPAPIQDTMAPVTVVGGGITAAQVALAQARRSPGTVTLVLRHPPRLHELDADPGWMGPKRLRAFHSIPCLHWRRQAIQQARHRGSIPPRIWADVRRAETRGQLQVLVAEVLAAAHRGGVVRLVLRGSERAETVLTTRRVVLATGFEPIRPGSPWLDTTVAAEGLPLAPCGFPRVDPALRWAPGLYVSGGLAELELGPVARNILGARMAAERIAPGPRA